MNVIKKLAVAAVLASVSSSAFAQTINWTYYGSVPAVHDVA